jgi:adenosylcobinamide kinase / adenosylcobinamide-phosphate guanylyltransferase
MASITLITGGARSGKSFFAQELAKQYNGNRIFIATAQGFDVEMEERIKNHRAERGEHFSTVEAPLDLAAALRNVPDDAAVVLIDCLTVWLGNLMYRHENDRAAIDAAITDFTGILDVISQDIVIVTNEVGMGIVPGNFLARHYRDIAGSLNREVARKAAKVYLCVCGIPVAVKGERNEGGALLQ